MNNMAILNLDIIKFTSINKVVGNRIHVPNSDPLK